MKARQEEGLVSDSKCESSRKISNLFRIGGSLFYSLSALSIIWGLSEVVGPIFSTNRLWEKVVCIGVLNLYELALLGMLLLLTVWKKVQDDAVVLVVISALFYVSGGVIIDIIANDSISFSGVIGTAALIFALFRLFVLKSSVKMKISFAVFLGLAMICAWNYLIATFMSKVHQYLSVKPEIAWRYGWAVMLAGIVMVLINIIRTPSESEIELEPAEKLPFLSTNSMTWIFSAEIILLSCLHQYILAYIYDLQISFGDFIPACTLLIFFLAEAMRIAKIESKGTDVVLSLIPLMLIVFGKLNGSLNTVSGEIGFIWNPGFIGVISLIWCISFVLRRMNFLLIYSASAYAIFLLLFGFTASDTQLSFQNANWHALAIVSIFVLLAAGIMFRKGVLIYLGVIAGIIGIAVNPVIESFCLSNDISHTGFGLMLIGIGMLVLYPFTKEDISPAIPYFGSFIFAFGIITITSGNSSAGILAGTAIISCILAFLWYFISVQDKAITVIICSPLLFHAYLVFSSLHGWHYVLIGFILLILGGAVSIMKNNKFLTVKQ